MKIKIERSGGIGGITYSSELAPSKLPPPLKATVREFLDWRKLAQSNDSIQPEGAADYLNYKIKIQNGTNDRVIECSEIERGISLKSLISLVQKNSKKK